MDENNGHPADLPTRSFLTPRTARTPNRRAVSAEPISSQRLLRTPHTGNSTKTPNPLSSGRQGFSASGKKNNAPTPHAKAVIRDIGLRRAAVFTPGKGRRTSIKDQRESPRQALRLLSGLLKKGTDVLDTPAHDDEADDTLATADPNRKVGDDSDDDLPIDRPRLSLALDADDDDDLQAPTSHGLEDENYTMQSVERPRRAISEQPWADRERGSLGVRISDYFRRDEGTGDVGFDSGFFPRIEYDDIAQTTPGADATLER
jgi:hypothetical protein